MNSSSKASAHDAQTLSFYDGEAETYASRVRASDTATNKRLEAFLRRVAAGGKILELGCGGGQDSEAMIRAGFDVTPTDGSVGLARVAEQRLGRPVKVLRFEDLGDKNVYDAVWANACLLHVPEDRLADVLAKIHAALKPGGLFYASYKEGDGGERDKLGRYYNYPPRNRLAAIYRKSATWHGFELDAGAAATGYDGTARVFLHVLVRK